jgi:hypothetical protein
MSISSKTTTENIKRFRSEAVDLSQQDARLGRCLLLKRVSAAATVV